MKRFYTTFLLLILALSNLVGAEFNLASIFGENMVLQRDEPIRIWGTDKPNSKIEIKLQKQKATTIADAKGKWIITLKPEKTAFVAKLTAKGSDTTYTFNNIAIGELWIASGQSNMEYLFEQFTQYRWKWRIDSLIGAPEPAIRMIKVKRLIAPEPIENATIEHQWAIASPQSLGYFSVVGYYFAKYLNKELKVPVGIVAAAWGGARIEPFVPSEGFSDATYSNQKKQIADLRFLEWGDYSKGADPKPKFPVHYLQTVAHWADSTNKLFPYLTQSMYKFQEKQKDYADWVAYSPWKTIEQSFPEASNPNGIYWLKCSFTIPNNLVGKPLNIEMNRLNNWDKTYWNGKLIGESRFWGIERNYTIPAEINTSNQVELTLRLAEWSNKGGFALHGKQRIKVSGNNYEYSIDTLPWIAKNEVFFKSVPNFPIQPEPELDYLDPRQNPTVMYNAMIAPLTKLNVKGIIWYQGESNAYDSTKFNSGNKGYAKMFELLINQWRQKFSKPEMGFYFVQLAGWEGKEPRPDFGWPLLREAQASVLKLPKTGMAVAFELGDRTDIHPPYKDEVGRRLAASALHTTYGLEVPHLPAKFDKAEISGQKIRVYFEHVYSGLKSADGKPLIGFELHYSDGSTETVTGKIVANNVVELLSPANKQITAISYGYRYYIEGANLTNSPNLGVIPFKANL